MAGVTKEEIARAKELDLLTYFKLVEPGNLKLVGKEYRHKVHSSLTISKDSLWCWHCIGLRGRTALKYLIDVEKVPYVEAVREINRIQGGVVHSSQPVSLPQPCAEPEAPRTFTLITPPHRVQCFHVKGLTKVAVQYILLQGQYIAGIIELIAHRNELAGLLFQLFQLACALYRGADGLFGQHIRSMRQAGDDLRIMQMNGR